MEHNGSLVELGGGVESYRELRGEAEEVVFIGRVRRLIGPLQWFTVDGGPEDLEDISHVSGCHVAGSNWPKVQQCGSLCGRGISKRAHHWS